MLKFALTMTGDIIVFWDDTMCYITHPDAWTPHCKKSMHSIETSFLTTGEFASSIKFIVHVSNESQAQYSFWARSYLQQGLKINPDVQ